MNANWQACYDYALALGLDAGTAKQYADDAGPNVDSGIWALGTARNWIKTQAINYGQIAASPSLPDPYAAVTTSAPATTVQGPGTNVSILTVGGVPVTSVASAPSSALPSSVGGIPLPYLIIGAGVLYFLLK